MNGGSQFWAKQFVNEAGTPYAGVKVYHYASGSSNDKTVWADEGKTTESSQPVTGDSRGYAWFYADGDYRIKITDALGNVLYDWDNVRITQDMATMWEGNYGLSYPNAGTANRWQMFLKHTAGNKFSELGVNDGTAFIPLLSVDTNQKYALSTGGGGTPNTYVITTDPPITAYVTGQVFYFKAAIANTGASALNVDGFGVKNIKKDYDQATVSGDIKASQIVAVIYDGTNFQMLSYPADVVTEGATQTLTGKTIQGTFLTVSIAEIANMNVERHGGLRVAVVNIGDWNMDSTSSVSVAHGLTLSKIRYVEVLIRRDDNLIYYPMQRHVSIGSLTTSADADAFYGQPDADLINELKADINTLRPGAWIDNIDATNVTIFRATGGDFDAATFDSTSFNRGWITIFWEP
jgi:hypothetical protein